MDPLTPAFNEELYFDKELTDSASDLQNSYILKENIKGQFPESSLLFDLLSQVILNNSYNYFAAFSRNVLFMYAEIAKASMTVISNKPTLLQGLKRHGYEVYCNKNGNFLSENDIIEDAAVEHEAAERAAAEYAQQVRRRQPDFFANLLAFDVSPESPETTLDVASS